MATSAADLANAELILDQYTEPPPSALSEERAEAGERAFLPAFFGVLVKVPLTVRQCELSPPHTPHLSSTLLEPISLLQPTFWKAEQSDDDVSPATYEPVACLSFNRRLVHAPELRTCDAAFTSSPHTPHARRYCRRPCTSSASRRAPAASCKPRPPSPSTGSTGGTSCWLQDKISK